MRNKILRAEEAGIKSLEYRLSAETSQGELLQLIADLNADNAVNGILLQLPLPEHIEEARALQAIAPGKDVDGFHSENVGGLSQGRDVLTPCTPAAACNCLKRLAAT